MSAKAKKLFAWLEEKGMLNYGSVIPGSLIREIAEIERPEIGTYEEYKQADLKQLDVCTWIKNHLLNDGKTLVQHNDTYRIPLASENVHEAKRLHEAANRKIKRAEKLLRNTPPLPQYQRPNHSRTRAERKQEHRRIPGQPIP